MILLLLTTLSFAQDSSTTLERDIVYKQKTEIDFEAVDIEGQLKKPQGSLISEKNRAIFNPLIQIREEWNQEMINSLNQVQ